MDRGLYFGADYYPEHWPRRRWETDAALMRELGLDVVRMAEFSWSRLEPEPGRYAFEWLDEAIAVLAAQGIKVVLGTPTAAPPAWLVEKHPDVLPVDYEGRTRHFGGRHHACQSNAALREHAVHYATALAKHYAGNPHVVGFQTDNELGNSHQTLCYCQSCAAAFRAWLEKRYGTVEALNRAWGTVFWSQEYNTFAQVNAPRLTATGHNPSALLDWKRFCSDLICEFNELQVAALREHAPGKFVTHNLMGFAEKVDYFKLGTQLDFVSHDQYPLAFFRPEGTPPHELAATLDLIRGLKEQSYWIMEQQAGITGWEVMGPAPKPGQLALWAQQSIAHGADCVVFFRWRSCAVGTEQYWHGILPHSGQPGRVYGELKRMIAKMRPVMPLLQGTAPKSRVAVVYSYDQLYALQIQPQRPGGMDYVDILLRYYEGFYRQNIPVDFVAEGADLSGYAVAVAPVQYLCTEAQAKRYADFVAKGGYLLMGCRAGVKDATNLCHTDGPLPGPLAGVLGVEVPEYTPLLENLPLTWGGQALEGEQWADVIQPKGAQVLATDAAGAPAVTVNRHGEGQACYVGTVPGPALALQLAREAARAAGLPALSTTPEGVALAHRETAQGRMVFVMNHTGEEKTLAVPESWQPAAENDGSPRLAPYEVKLWLDKA